MKAFVKKTILFLLILLGTVILIEASTCFLVNKNADFKLIGNPKYVVAGHSHPECAFNDSLISNFKNISRSGESYFYTYIKVKKILEQNNSIETVFIEYTNNQIIPEMDNWTWDEEFISDRYTKYSSFMSFNDHTLLIQNAPRAYLNGFLLSNTVKLSMVMSNDYDYTNKIGGYMYLVRDKTDSILSNSSKTTSKIEVNANMSNRISETNLLYLGKTIELIKKYGKKVILIRSPQHPKYTGYENEVAYKEILSNRFGNVAYLDFSKFPVSNSDFGDLQHLNHKGAKLFSIWFDELIKSGLLLKNNKQEFINEKIKMRQP